MEYLDNSRNGVIYFSLGSNIVTESLQHRNVLESLIRVFGALNYNVLWKTDHSEIEMQASNIKCVKWVEQRQVLRKKKILAFPFLFLRRTTNRLQFYGVTI